MGQNSSSQSSKKLTPDQVSRLFASRCAKQFRAIDIWSLKDTFSQLAEQQDDIIYWKQDSFIKYLGIPDTANVSDLLFKSASFLASFPFLNSMAPAPLTVENLAKVIALTQGKYKGILQSEYDVNRVIFLSFAVIENDTSREPAEEEEDDDLIMFNLSDLDTWDELDVIQKFDKLPTSSAYVLGPDLLSLFAFLLAISSLEAPTPLSELASNFDSKTYYKFRRAGLNLIRSIDSTIATEADLVDKKVTFEMFRPAFESVFPHILVPLGELFGLLFFGKNLRPTELISEKPTEKSTEIEGLFAHEDATKLVNPVSMSQMAALFGHSAVYGRLKKLYVGSDAGFSMRSFETKVFKWQAPTFLLVSGRLLGNATTSRAKSFNDHIPPMKKLIPHTPGTVVTYGVYMTAPWKSSSKTCFGNSDALMFQLEPIQDKFTASPIQGNYLYFSRLQPGGIGAGSSPPQTNQHVKSANGHGPFSLGNISLTLNESLEFGIFRHLGLGGTFRPSATRGTAQWEDRFEITDLEVWGSGRDEDLEAQKKQWEWEEREASYRARVNLQGTSEDRTLLEMAGLVGNHGGGSM